MSSIESGRVYRWAWGACIALAAVCLAGSAVAKEKPGPGYVDATTFIDIAGDDNVVVEISIPGPLIRALTKIDPELHQLAGGLQSIQAVILDLTGRATEDDDAAPIPGLLKKARTVIGDQESRLLGRGWERLARVRDTESEVRILILNDEEVIRGLVVMVVDKDEGQMVFVNIAGVLDLAALEAIGEQFDIPGLDELKP